MKFNRDSLKSYMRNSAAKTKIKEIVKTTIFPISDTGLKITVVARTRLLFLNGLVT